MLLCDSDLHLPGEATLEVVDYFESLDSGWAGESAPALISFAGWLGFQSMCSLALRIFFFFLCICTRTNMFPTKGAKLLVQFLVWCEHGLCF